MIRRRLDLLKIWRRERSLLKEYRELTQKLRAQKAGDDDFQMATQDLRMMVEECYEDRRYVYHQELGEKAARLFISLPPRKAKETYEDDEYWVGLPVTDRWVLSIKGIRQVRSEIREESKARRDYILGWISPFIALVGAVVGYLLGRGAH